MTLKEAMKVGIVDYRMGNLASVSKALQKSGVEPLVSDQAAQLEESDLVVLPGVGNFAAGMMNLNELSLADFVIEWAGAGKPLLGICMGMQLLFDESDEGPAKGLGILPGRVEKFKPGLTIPHMGWNTLKAGGSPVFEEAVGEYFYFVHSYYCAPDNASHVAAWTDYGGDFASAVHSGKVHGVQFHPEKSSDGGLALLAKILEEMRAETQR